MCGLAFNNQATANKKTDAKITASLAFLKKVIKTFGMVCPNSSTTMFENAIIAMAVKV